MKNTLKYVSILSFLRKSNESNRKERAIERRHQEKENTRSHPFRAVVVSCRFVLSSSYTIRENSICDCHCGIPAPSLVK